MQERWREIHEREVRRGQSPRRTAENDTAERPSPHSPELMSVVTTWRKGKLVAKTVVFSHDCGRFAQQEVQEELPW